jgi:hypoxanthine phosphoribosyltransferase
MLELLYDEHTVNQRIAEMAAKIVERYKGKDPLFVCLLRGGAPFATKLMFEITKINPTFYPEMDYMIIKTYGDRREGTASELITDLTPDTVKEGRLAVVLDDTLDKGITAAFAEDHLKNIHRVQDVELIVMVEKDIRRERFPTATLSCFTAGPEWLVGMGLDDTATHKEAGRWASDISVITNSEK